MTAARLRAEPALLALRGGFPPSIDGDEVLRTDHSFTQCRRCWMRHRAYRRAPVPVSPHP